MELTMRADDKNAASRIWLLSSSKSMYVIMYGVWLIKYLLHYFHIYYHIILFFKNGENIRILQISTLPPFYVYFTLLPWAFLTVSHYCIPQFTFGAPCVSPYAFLTVSSLSRAFILKWVTTPQITSTTSRCGAWYQILVAMNHRKIQKLIRSPIDVIKFCAVAKNSEKDL